MHFGDLNAQIPFNCLRAEHTVPVRTVASVSISYVHKIQNVASYLYIPILFLILVGG